MQIYYTVALLNILISIFSHFEITLRFDFTIDRKVICIILLYHVIKTHSSVLCSPRKGACYIVSIIKGRKKSNFYVYLAL